MISFFEGKDGRDGRDGAAGPPGPPGTPGLFNVHAISQLMAMNFLSAKGHQNHGEAQDVNRLH